MKSPPATTLFRLAATSISRWAPVRLEWLEKSAKTAHDLECPHGVQFYDVIVDGERHLRNAWSYEAPQPKMEAVRDRFGFWEDVRGRLRVSGLGQAPRGERRRTMVEPDHDEPRAIRRSMDARRQ